MTRTVKLLLLPNSRCQDELVVVLEWRQHGLPHDEVGHEAAGEDDRHGGHPAGQGVLATKGDSS